MIDEAALITISERNKLYFDWIAAGKHWMEFHDPESAADRDKLLKIIHFLKLNCADVASTQHLVAAAQSVVLAHKRYGAPDNWALGDEEINAGVSPLQALESALLAFGVKS